MPIREEEARFHEWEKLSQEKFQRRAGFFFTSIDTRLDTGNAKLVNHEDRIAKNEKRISKGKTIILTFLALGGFGFIIGIAIVISKWLGG